MKSFLKTNNIIVGFVCFILIVNVIPIYSQALKTISPDTVTQGQYVKIAIHGANTSFTKITSSHNVYFQQNYDYNIYADSTNVFSDTFMYGYFQIPYSFSGSFELFIISDITQKLTNALFILTQSIKPEITRIEPDSVYQGDDYVFRIYGSDCHFQNCSYFRVWLVSFYADSLIVLNDTTVEVHKHIPLYTHPGSYSIMIENSIDGIITKDTCIRVLKSPVAPYLVSVNPDSVEQGKTLKALICGVNTHFSGTSIVRFNQASYEMYCDSLTIINDTALYVYLTPVFSCKLGIYNIGVATKVDGYLQLANSFTVVAPKNPPQLLSVTPSSATQDDKITVSITGKNTHFKSKYGVGAGFHNISSISVSNLTVVNDTFMYGDVSVRLTNEAGLYNLYVHDSMDGSLVIKGAFTVYAMKNPPEIILALPDTMVQDQKYVLKIFCQNTHFKQGTTPRISMISDKSTVIQESVTVINDSILFATVNIKSNQKAGVYDLNVFGGIDGTISIPSVVSILNSQKSPQIKIVKPDKILAGDSYTISIIGKNTKFKQVASQNIKIPRPDYITLYPTTVNVINDTLINVSFSFPPNMKLGWYEIQVLDSGNVALTYPFEIILPPSAPQIVSISPNSVKCDENKLITIYARKTRLTLYKEYQKAFFVRNSAKDTIYGTNYSVINDSTATIEIDPPADKLPVEYDLILKGSVDGDFTLFKALTLNRFSSGAKILQVTPDTVYVNKIAELEIKCSGTKFYDDEIIFSVFSSQSGSYLTADSIQINNDSTLLIWLSLPGNAEKGVWNLTLNTDQEGDFTFNGNIHIDWSDNISKISESKIEVIPNPFNDYLEIRSKIKINQIEIINMTGNTVLTKVIENTSVTKIDLGWLSSGIYILKLVNEDEIIIKKLLKN